MHRPFSGCRLLWNRYDELHFFKQLLRLTSKSLIADHNRSVNKVNMAISSKKFGLNFLGYLVSARYLMLCLGFIFVALWLLLWFSEADGGKHYGAWESLYLACISALTIGYGDLFPVTILGRITAVALGLLGIVFTGIIVAAAVIALPESEE